MASGAMTVVGGETNSSGAMVVRPQVVGVAAEQQRAIAEIQAALTVAKASRRDEVDCVDRIKTACQRVGLAEKAEYAYSRGGNEITGATIDLLTVIANCWGNIQFGFRELTQAGGESTVEAFAWDLETNSKRTVVFTVPHKRHTRNGSTNLTDPRDIYELVANQAQRRVRACLEAIIPPDVLEDAVAQCRATLSETADVNPESIGKVVDAFAALGVTADQIQTKLGRRLEAMQPAQLISLRRIYKSIKDGMSKPGDWFEGATEPEPKATAAEAAKTALKKKPEPQEPSDPITVAATKLAACTTTEAIDEVNAEIIKTADLTDEQGFELSQLIEKRQAEIESAASKAPKGKQKTFTE